MTGFIPTDILFWIVFVGLVCFAWMSWLRVQYGLYIITALLPIYIIRLSLFSIPTTALEIAIITLFIIWLLRGKKWKRINWLLRKKHVENKLPNVYRLPLILLITAATIAAFVSHNQPDAFGIWKAYFIEPILLLIVLVYEIRDERSVIRLLHALGFTTIVLGIIGIIQYTTGIGIPAQYWTDTASRRITTVFGYPNANSLFAGPIIALYLGYIFKRDTNIIQLLKIIVIISGLLLIAGAKSTGALIAIIALILILLLKYQKTRTIGIATIIITLTILLGSPTAKDTTSQTIRNLQSNYLDLDSSSLDIRLNQWRETIQFLGDKPVLGAGLAGYQQALQPYHSYDFLEIFLYPHNIILNFWVEIGLLGLIAIVWLMILSMRSLVRSLTFDSHSWLAWALLFAWIEILIHGLVDVPYFKNDLSVLFMILLGLTMIIPTIKLSK